MGWAVWRRSCLNRNAQCDLQWAGAIGVGAGAGWGTRRIAESYSKEWYGAGDRDMVIYDGKDASFCRSHRFVCSFIARLPPFLPTLFILVRFFFFFMYLLTSIFLTRLLSLLSIFSHSPAFTAQRSNSSNLRFCGYHRRTEIHATTCACFVRPDRDLFRGRVGSALNNVSTLPHLLDANSKSRSTVHIRSTFVPTVLSSTTSVLAPIPPSTPLSAHPSPSLSPFLMLFANLS